jgi:hypothetical protein
MMAGSVEIPFSAHAQSIRFFFEDPAGGQPSDG